MSYKVGDIYTLNEKFYTRLQTSQQRLFFKNHSPYVDWAEWFSGTGTTHGGAEITSAQGEFPTTPGTTLLWESEPTAWDKNAFLEVVPHRKCYLIGLGYILRTVNPQAGFTNVRIGVVKGDHASGIDNESTSGEFYSLGHVDTHTESEDQSGLVYHGHAVFSQPASGSNAIVDSGEGVGLVFTSLGTGTLQNPDYIYGTLTAVFMAI